MSAERSPILYAFRPGWWLAVFTHFIVGVLFAGGADSLLAPGPERVRILLAAAIWAVGLTGAAAGLSSSFSTEPPENGFAAVVSRFSGWVGLTLMLAGLLAAPALSWWFFDVYLAGIVVVVAYIVPPLRAGRHPLAGALLEGLAFAPATLYAGSVIVLTLHRPGNALILYSIAFAFLVFAIRTVLRHDGQGLTPLLYLVCLANAFICMWTLQIKADRPWGMVPLLAPLTAWGLLGLWRFGPHKRNPPPPRLSAIVIALCLLTDATMALTPFLRW